MKISILTATYNRAHLLENLFNSLKKNYKTYKNFEWIIIDDGSLDDTKKLVNDFKKIAKFDIKYIYQKNQGKMMAINNGMDKVTGDIVIEMDSDDIFLDDAFLKIKRDFDSIKDKNVYGIIYKRKLLQKDNYVNDIINDKIMTLFDIHNTYGYDFDMTIAFLTKERKKYKYELEHNEKFVTEARLYYKMDQDYDGLLFKNDELIICEYFLDGYSKNINDIFRKYPYGYRQYFNECLKYSSNKTLFAKKIYFIKHYILFSYLTNKKIIETIKEAKKYKLLIILLIIPGFIKSRSFKK